MKPILILIIGFFFFANSHEQVSRIDTSFNKWIHSVLNIEVRTAQYKIFENVILAERFAGHISRERMHQLEDSVNHLPPIIWMGTAILLEHNGHHFLLTARHILAQPMLSLDYLKSLNLPDFHLLADTAVIASDILLIENDTFLNKKPYFIDKFNNRYTNSDESISLRLSYGIPNMRPYLFSSIEDDLGVICIDKDSIDGISFYKTLVNRGFTALKPSDIDSNFSPKKYQTIFAIGFPENSIFYNKGYFDEWESNFVTIPVITKGIYDEEYPLHSNFFDAFIYVTHGFSGGPIICNGKLIGLVSGGDRREVFETKSALPFKYGVNNHSKFIKSSLILPLIRQLESKLFWK